MIRKIKKLLLPVNEYYRFLILALLLIVGMVGSTYLLFIDNTEAMDVMTLFWLGCAEKVLYLLSISGLLYGCYVAVTRKSEQ